MSEKLILPAPANPVHPVDAEGCIAEQLCPSECRNLILRLSGTEYQDVPSEGRCLVILDVRTPQEYGLCHLNGSINLDFRSPSFRDRLEKLDRDKAYLLYCRTGVRSGRVLQIMRSLGFKGLYNLTKGIEQWQREGYDVIRDSGK